MFKVKPIIAFLALACWVFSAQATDKTAVNAMDVIIPANNLDIIKTADKAAYVYRHYGLTSQDDVFLNPKTVAALGFGKAGGATTADEVVYWSVLAELTTPNAEVVHTLQVEFGKGLFSPLEHIPYPLYGVESVTLTDVKMTLEKAIELKNKAGWPEPFARVALYKPLDLHSKEVYYIFDMLTSAIFVGTTTGEVFEEIPESKTSRSSKSLFKAYKPVRLK